jgi:hypothetical protein
VTNLPPVLDLLSDLYDGAREGSWGVADDLAEHITGRPLSTDEVPEPVFREWLSKRLVEGPVLGEIAGERARQDAKWGPQSHPDGTGRPGDRAWADVMRDQCDHEHRSGLGTWRTILAEEVFEAFAEADLAKLREELVQVAAVAAAWVEAIDRRPVDLDALERLQEARAQ